MVHIKTSKWLRLATAFWLLAIAGPASATEAEKTQLFVVHYETGPSWDEALSPQQQAGFGEHSKFLQHLRREGKIKFGARYQQFGMIFLEGSHQQAVVDLLESDPGVRSELFTYRVAPMAVFFSWSED